MNTKNLFYRFINLTNKKQVLFYDKQTQEIYELIFQYFQYRFRYILGVLLFSITVYPIYLLVALILLFLGQWTYILEALAFLAFNIVVHNFIVFKLKKLAVNSLLNIKLLEKIRSNSKFLLFVDIK